MSSHILKEAKRCLQCKNPLCEKGCPVNTPIKEMIDGFINNKIPETGKMLFKNNPLSVVCSLVCPHEAQCEGSCVLNQKDIPINISQIEHYISDYYLNTIEKHFEPITKEKIAIIGSGPAGITIALMLAMKGYDVTIFEAKDKIGGVLRYGIPEFRLPKSILDRIHDKLIALGISIRPNTLIGPTLTINDLFFDGYKAIFIGTGIWKPRKLNIKGESLAHVHFAIDYLKNPDVYNLGKNVVIIGAGNVAMDVARTAIRHKSKNVTILYRKGEKDIPARQDEVDYAKVDGVKFEYFKQPTEFNDQGVVYNKTYFEKDENGKNKFKVDKSKNFLLKADSIIEAISQGPQTNIVSTCEDIETSNKGLVKTKKIGQTTKDGVFASGDVVHGAKTVVEAVHYSKKVAQQIENYLKNK